ncbi:MAG: 4Fe-4S binding protein [Gammaproteobacteria bacterium]
MTVSDQAATASLSASTPDGQARAAALAAASHAGRQPAGIVSYQSAGRLLVIGSAAAIREVTPALDTQAGISYSGLITDAGDGLPVVTGFLGRFEVQTTTGEPQVYDLVLDLASPPLLQAEVLPPGYFAPNGNPAALQAALDELPDLTGEFEKPQYFRYDATICAHGRSGITACTRCLDTCPTQAITSLGDTIEVNAGLCQGAGSCATACPTGAISYGYPRLADTLQRLRLLLQAYHAAGGTDAVLLFHDAGAGRDVMRQLATQLPERVIPLEVEELGSVGMDTWLAALAYGAAAVVLLATPSLPGRVMREVVLQMDVASQILAGMGYPAAVLQLCRSGDGAFPDLPGTAGRQPAGFAALDEKRTVIRLAVEHLQAQAPAPRPLVSLPAGAPFGEVLLDHARCTLCMACVSQCPARALAAGDDRPQLVFIEANCVQCGMCCRTCPEDAIAVSPRYLYASEQRNQRRVLCEAEPFLCVSCGKPFATRQVIEKIMSKMQGHAMFQGAALERLKMCADCRVKVLFAGETADDKPASPRGWS